MSFMSSFRLSHRKVFGLVVLAALVPAHAAFAVDDVPSLTLAAEAIRLAARDLPPLLRQGALGLWLALATLELIAFAFDRWHEKDKLAKPILRRTIWLSLTLAIVLALPANPLTPEVILGGAQHIFEEITGVPGLDPSAVFDQGLQLYRLQMDRFLSLGFKALLLLTDHTVGAYALSAIAHLVAYLVIAIAFFFLLVQGTVALVLAPIAAAFGAARWTIGLAESYASFLLWWSLKLIILAVILTIGNEVAVFTQTIILIASPQASLQFQVPWEAALISVAYAAAALLIPGQLAQKLTQSTAVSLRQILS